MKIKAVLFDLDGVLIDSRPPIASALHGGLVQNGYASPGLRALEQLIGPPLPTTFRELIGEQNRELSGEALEKEVEKCMDVYRSLYTKTSLTETVVMPGALETLSSVSGSFPIAVATSKPMEFTSELLDHLGISKFLNVVSAPNIGNEDEPKKETIGRALLQLQVTGGPEVLLLGDRSSDIKAARVHGLTALGATWGIGSRSELESERCDHIFDSFSDFCSFLEKFENGEN